MKTEMDAGKAFNNTLGNPVFVNVVLIGGAIVAGYFIVKNFILPSAKKAISDAQKGPGEIETAVRKSVDSIIQPNSSTVAGQNPDSRTRTAEVKGLVSGLIGMGGDRALDDLLGNPVGTTLFLITGNTDHLKG